MVENIDETYDEFIKDIDSKSLSELQEYTKQLALWHKEREKHWICSNHTLEIYLYEYWIQKRTYQVSNYRIHELYRKIAQRQEEIANHQEAEEAYQEALQWNPTDLDTIFLFCGYYRTQGEWYAMKEITDNAYHFLFTNMDISKYYRFLGRFYLETYQPEEAMSLYRYANLWNPSQEADSAIQFLEEAMSHANGSQPGAEREDNHQIEGLQRKLQDMGIPIQPDEKTLGLLYELGKREVESEDTEYGRYLLQCLFQLTGDSEVEKLLANYIDDGKSKGC